MSTQQENPDGTWGPIHPIPLGSDIDFEVCGTGPYRWEAMRGMDVIASGKARTRLGLETSLRIVRLRYKIKR